MRYRNNRFINIYRVNNGPWLWRIKIFNFLSDWQLSNGFSSLSIELDKHKTPFINAFVLNLYANPIFLNKKKKIMNFKLINWEKRKETYWVQSIQARYESLSRSSNVPTKSLSWTFNLGS